MNFFEQLRTERFFRVVENISKKALISRASSL
jgi:hypothetical protein